MSTNTDADYPPGRADERATQDSDERATQEQEALRAECDALRDLCRRRADAEERQEERQARALAAWQANPWGPGGIKPCLRRRPPDPLPLRDGLRSPLSRMVRKMDTLEGRLLVAVRVAEALVLPRLAAADAEERARVNALLAHALRLDLAVTSGLLSSFAILWKGGRWPRRPVSVRLSWPGGRAQADRVVGEHGQRLQSLAADLACKPLVPMLNGRVIDRPPLPLSPVRRW